MKKYFVVLAALALVFAGCKPTQSGSTYTKISFKQTELTLGIGETEKLIVRWEPTSITTAPECTFETSNENVATVDEKGVVTAVASGEANITAKHGDLTAVCPVTVADPRTLYSWGGIARFSDQQPFEEGGELPIYQVELSDGVYNCYYGLATYYFWDDGVSIVNNSLTGEGYIFAMDVPCYVIADGEYAGASVGSPIYLLDREFNPADTAYAYCVQAGSLGNAADWYDWLTNEESEVEYSDCWKGPECMIFSEDNFYYPSWPGILNAGYIYGNYQTMRMYDFSATWADGSYGLAIDESGEEPKVKEPYEWATITCDYVLQPNAAPKAKVAKKINTTNLKKAAMPIKAFKTSDKLVVKK